MWKAAVTSSRPGLDDAHDLPPVNEGSPLASDVGGTSTTVNPLSTGAELYVLSSRLGGSDRAPRSWAASRVQSLPAGAAGAAPKGTVRGAPVRSIDDLCDCS